MEIEDHGGLLDGELVDCLQEIEDADVDEVGVFSLECSDKLRKLAKIYLLTCQSSAPFTEELKRSGQARIVYLSRCESEELKSDFHFAAGRYEPLLDLIAVGDWKQVSQLASLSPRQWREGSEHPGDFAYANFLKMFVQDAKNDDISVSIDALRETNEPQLARRASICEALATKDQAMFDTGFNRLLEEIEAEVGPYSPWDFDRFVELHDKPEEINEFELRNMLDEACDMISIEALAILRLAERCGLNTRSNYSYCPSSGRNL